MAPTLKCCNCDRQGPPSAFVLLRTRAECPRCRAQAFVVPAMVVGVEPTVMDGYENVTALYHNAALINGPADVQAAKDDLRPYFAQTAQATGECGQDADSLSAYWSVLYNEWRTFDASRPSYITASQDMTHATQLRLRLRAYQEQLSTLCPSAGLLLVPPPSPSLVDKIAQAGQQAASGVQKSAESYATAVKVALVVGGIVAVYAVYKTMQGVSSTAKMALESPEKVAKLAKLAAL